MKIKPLILISTLVFVIGLKDSVSGQDFTGIGLKYPFLKLDQNQIIFYGNNPESDLLFQKMDQIVLEGSGTLKVLHIGGSHVQGGALQHHMREGLNTFLPGAKGERGFFFPYVLANTNMPEDYKVTYTGKWTGCRSSLSGHHCDWGVSGISAITQNENATIQVKIDGHLQEPYFFKRARIYYAMKPESYEITLDTGLVAERVSVDSSGRFIEFAFSERQEELRLKLRKSDSVQKDFTIQGIEFLNDEAGITYHTLGVNGVKAASYLRGEKFSDQLSYLKPDLVLFGLGINDANVPENNFNYVKYKQEYDTLIRMFQLANPNVQMIFFTNNDSYYKRSYPNKNVFKVREVMVELAKKHNAAIWDFFEIMGGLQSIFLWEKAALAKHDYIHLTPKGYQLQAQLFLNAFKRAYIDHISKNEN